MESIFIKTEIIKPPVIDTLISLAKEIPQTRTDNFGKVEILKSGLENTIKQFLKEQFSDTTKITEIHYSVDRFSALIRCIQSISNSNKWRGHEFKIYTETKEIKHSITNETSQPYKLTKFLSTGIAKI